MCGIAGIIAENKEGCLEESIRIMNASLRHRGPDGEGFSIHRGVAFGHRRLSIIDLDAGAQPLCNEDGSVWVTYNGEIYNYVELQSELESLGHTFRTRCDTEVIVHAYEEWGSECVQHFRGMFSFAVHDRRKNEVFLARDRLGIKPLVYLIQPGQFAFASELQAIAALPSFSPRLNLDALDYYLQFQYIPAPETIYRDVYKLLPGHTMIVRQDGTILGPNRYWDVEFHPEEDQSEDDWIDELDATIREAVRLRLRSDVPFGAFLSGGVDSSVVVAYMAELLRRPVQTFSIGFDEESFSEIPFARKAAQTCRTEHFEEIVRPEALAILPELARHYGEPFGDSSAVPTFHVSRLARRHVKMVLSGDGGDENFAGYQRYGIAMQMAPPVRWTIRRRAQRAAGNLARMIGVLPPRKQPIEEWLQTSTIFSTKTRRELVRKDGWPESSPPISVMECYHRARDRDFCSLFQYFDIKTYLPFSILTKVDIASMYHGLEVRVPLLDHIVVELAAKIPSSLKVTWKNDGVCQEKAIFKRLANRWYPKDFISRKKRGFELPLRQWLNQSTSTQWLEDYLFWTGSPVEDLFDRKAISSLVKTGNATQTWLLLCLSEWFRQHPRVSLP